ncbi:MAG: hypothetical protein O3B64_03225 [bacterium]|nr:hypothetical protein [bacterium]
MTVRIRKEMMKNSELFFKASSTSPPGENRLTRAILLQSRSHPVRVFGVMRFLGKATKGKAAVVKAIEDALQQFFDDLLLEGNRMRKFEHMLGELNKQIQDIASTQTLPSADTDMVIGFSDEGQVFATGTGRLQALFMHKTAAERYTLYELGQQFPELPEWTKCFSVILDGEWHASDIFYIAPRIPIRYLSNESLQETLVTLQPAGALKRIEQFLPATMDFGSICLKALQPTAIHSPKKLNPIASIKELAGTKETTAGLLGETSLRPSVLYTALLEMLKKPGTSGPSAILRRGVFLATKGIGFFISILFETIKVLVGVAESMGKWAFRQYTKRHSHKARIDKTKARIQDTARAIRHMPVSTRYAIATFLILIIAASFGFRMKANNAARFAERERIQTQLTFARERMQSAEASLIYGDDNQANTLLTEALLALDGISPADESLQSEKNELEGRLRNISNSAKGITTIELAAIGSLDAAHGLVRAIATQTGTPSVITASGAVYALNSLNDRFELQYESTIPNAVSFLESTSDVLIIDDTQQLYMRVNDTTIPITSGTNRLPSADGMELYGDNLYVLTSEQGQIYKMRPQGNGYEAGTLWITSSTTETRGAVSLAIDSDIYVLMPNELLRFRSGREQGFETETLDPPLTAAVQVWTNIDSSYLYVLEPSEKRIIVFNKDGSIERQYVSDALEGAIGFSVNESRARMYVTTETDFFQFTPEHLVP